nr:hypothetical protein [Streptomyces sp. TS71-3]
MGVDEGLRYGQAQAGAGVAAPADEQPEDLAAQVGAHAGPGVGDRHGDHRRVGVLGGDGDRAALGRVPQGVLHQVAQHADDQHHVDVDDGEVVGQVEDERLVARGGRRVREDGVDEVAQVGDAGPGPQHPGLHAAHVEHARDQRGEPVGLGVDQAGEFAPRLGVETVAQLRVGEGRRGGLDGRQRGPQVVRDGGDERAGEAVHLLGEFGAQGLFAQLGALDGEGDLVGEQQQRLPLQIADRDPGERQHADRPARGDEGEPE